MILENKTVVVVGVGPGLGREIAAASLRDGANVVIAARKEERLAAIAKELDPSGERCLARPLDMTDRSACEALFAETAHHFGAVHAIANVAALDALFGTLESTSEKDWKSALEVNVIGNMNVVAAAAPKIKESGGGSIVLIGSQSMFLAPPMHQIAYASSKGALVAAMKHLADELGPDRIRVNMVIPTWMWGPPVEAYVAWQAKERNTTQEAVIEEITAKMPLGEIPKDDDVAEAVVFFFSDRSRMITGASLSVDAGEFIR